MNYTEYTEGSHGVKYKITESGTAYHIDTPDDLVEVLERIRHNNWRVTFDFGNTDTGESWNESYRVTGRIGRSTGRIKIPILVYNTRSWGGGALLDDCILSVKFANKKDGGYIYQLKNQKVGA